MELSQKSLPVIPRWEKVDVRSVSVERIREFGEVYLPLALWHRLGLGKLLEELIEPGREKFVLCRSTARAEKERAMLERQTLRLATELTKIQTWLVRSPQSDLEKSDAALVGHRTNIPQPLESRKPV